MEKDKQRDEVVSGIRACLVSTKGKCDLRQINHDYRMLMGGPIPYVALGFQSLEQFVRSVPTLSVSRENGQLMVDAKVTEKSAYLSNMVDKQRTTKKRARPQPRYTSGRSNFSQPSHSGTRWRPKYDNRNSTYQSSPRPAAVSHNQFVNIPPASRTANLPPRLNNRMTSMQENTRSRVSPPPPERARVLPPPERPRVSPPPDRPKMSPPPERPKVSPPVRQTVVEEPKRVRETSDVLSSTKQRINRKMANITINSTTTNGVDARQVQMNFMADGCVPLSPDEILRLRQESLAAVDLRNPIWTAWSSGDESPRQLKQNGVSQVTPPTLPPLPRQQDDMTDVKFDLTGDSVKDLHRFVATYNKGELMIKVLRRVLKSPKMTVFDCHIKLGSKNFSSYPEDCISEEAATELTAKRALEELMSEHNRRQSLLISDTADILERMPPIIQSHCGGVWKWQLEADYAESYKEQLPINWIEIIDVIPSITVCPQMNSFVLRYCKPGEVFQKGSTFAMPTLANVSVPSNTIKFDSNVTLLAEITCAVSARETWCRQVETAESVAFGKMVLQLEDYYRDFGVKADTVEVGGYYVAAYDGMWYRVRVFHIDGSDVRCFCIDFGDEWVVQKSDIFRLNREFAREQAQAFVCRLAGVEELYEASESSEYFNSLVGKVVQIYLDSDANDSGKISPDNPVLSVIMYEQDSDIPINQQLIHFIGIESALPVLSESSPTLVYVSHVEDDGSIFVQVHSVGYDQLNSILQEFENALLESKIELPKVVVTPANSQDKLYFTRYEVDGHYYRSKVVDWSPCKKYAQLQFVDFGNTVIVNANEQPLYSLDDLSDVVNQFPYQALRVRMNLKTIPADFAEKVKGLMLPDEPVLVKLIEERADSGHLVEFFKRSETDNVLFSVNMTISAESEFRPSQEPLDIAISRIANDGNNNSNKSQPSTKLQRLISLNQFDGTSKNVPSSGSLSCPPLPAVGQYFDVKIPCAVNPYNFFIQPYDSMDKLTRLMTALQERYKEVTHSPLQISDILPGKIYASKHNDGMWYRTSVIKVIHSGSISVFYCDFGYYANLTLTQLIPLGEEFMKLPYQAIKAKLSGIEPKNSKWSMDDCKFFEKLVCRKSFVSILVAKEIDDLYRYDTLLRLQLIDTKTNVDVYINKVLVQKGIAKAIEEEQN